MVAAVPTIVLNDTRVDGHHGCTRVMQALDGLLSANGCRVIARVPAHVDWESDACVLAAAAEARLVVVNGEGTIHHDRPAGTRLLRAGPWARERGIPAVLLNAGWEANRLEAVQRLREFSIVAVRDSRSAAEIRQHGGKCRVIPDLSLYAPWRDSGVERRGVAFTDNVERASTLRLDAVRREMQSPWLPIQSAAQGVSERVAFVRGGLARMDLRKPKLAWSMARARLSMARARLESPDVFLAELSRLQLLVTGRFHACTLAMLAATPFVAVPSNTGKIEALVRDAGLSTWRCGSDLSLSNLVDAARLGWEAGELVSLREYIAAGRRDADSLMHEIRSLA